MPRTAYKPLYQAALARYFYEQADHAQTTRRLKQIEAALIPYGEAVTHNLDVGDDSEILLDALQFVAVRAFIEKGYRVVGDQEHYDQHYQWRGRPIRNIGIKQGS